MDKSDYNFYKNDKGVNLFSINSQTALNYQFVFKHKILTYA